MSLATFKYLPAPTCSFVTQAIAEAEKKSFMQQLCKLGESSI
jgi:hypothetical protein